MAAAATAVTTVDNEALATEAPYMPLTYERRLRADLEHTLPKPCESPCLFTSPLYKSFRLLNRTLLVRVLVVLVLFLSQFFVYSLTDNSMKTSQRD